MPEHVEGYLEALGSERESLCLAFGYSVRPATITPRILSS